MTDHSRLIVWFLVLVLSPAIAQDFVDDSPVLVFVNDEKITERDYQGYSSFRTEVVKSNTAPGREVIFGEMIDRQLLSHAALERKLDISSDVQRDLEKCRENAQGPKPVSGVGWEVDRQLHYKFCRQNRLAREYIQQVVSGIHISDAGVRKHFEKEMVRVHKTEYLTQHILVKSEKEARDVKTALNNGVSFERLAKDKSLDEANKLVGGDIGWIDQGSEVSKDFFSALVTMKKGQISGPIKTEFGWHIIKIKDTRKLKLPTADEFMANEKAVNVLRRRMQEDAVSAALADLRKKAKITRVVQ